MFQIVRFTRYIYQQYVMPIGWPDLVLILCGRARHGCQLIYDSPITSLGRPRQG